LDGGNPWVTFTYFVTHSDFHAQEQSIEACMGLAQIEQTSCIERELETLFMHNNWSNFLVKASTLPESLIKCETA